MSKGPLHLWRLVVEPGETPYYAVSAGSTREEVIDRILHYHASICGRATLVSITLRAQDRGRKQVILVDELEH